MLLFGITAVGIAVVAIKQAHFLPEFHGMGNSLSTWLLIC
jgi:hypothetical protein